MSFLGFYPFPNWERVVNKNLGVKEKCPKVTYLIFLTGFHWRISLLSRANRLCIAFNAGLRDSGLSCLSLLSLARSEMAIVRLPRDLSKNYLIFCILLPLRGREPYFRLGSPPPIIWLHFLLPLPMSGDPRSLKCKHLCDPQSFLTVTFWLLDNVSSTGGGIIPTSLSSWAITWQVSYLGHSLVVSYFSVVKQSVYSTAPASIR